MKRKIAVFIASPNDLVKERELFRDAIRQLNVGFGDGADVEFEALGWEDTLASTGRRSQAVINEEIDRSDVFILAMHRRWGQEAPDANPCSSYTEEEFHRALARWEKEKKPEVFVFFKRVDPASEADAGPQLKKVMDFRKQLEETRQVLYHYFDNEASFIDKVDQHLRAYAKDELPRADQQRDAVILPLAVLEEVEKAKRIATKEQEKAAKARDAEREAQLKLEAMQLQMAEDAAALSKEGKIEFARQKFAELVVETSDLRILSLSFEFYHRTGDLDAAFSVLEKWLHLSGPDEKSAETAAAYGNLGILHKTRGDLERAEEMHEKSLAINEELGRKEGMAMQYGNLGILYYTQGELELAEEMYKKVLEIDKALGRKESITTAYGNLYYTRGELERAEEMYQKSLTIEEALGQRKGMASAYGNLGNVYCTQGELKQAEEMYRQSLAINEELGRKEGIALQYNNLGILYEAQGELKLAEEMYQKSLAIEEVLGRKQGIARVYCNLGNLHKTRGKLDRAEKMYEKSLAINEALGRKEGMAKVYNNLGVLYKAQGNLERAEEMHEKSSALFDELKSPVGTC